MPIQIIASEWRNTSIPFMLNTKRLLRVLCGGMWRGEVLFSTYHIGYKSHNLFHSYTNCIAIEALVDCDFYTSLYFIV